MKIYRERATNEADLPHRFQEAAESQTACGVCALGVREARHVAWENQQLVDREQAQQVFQRETGS